MGPKRVLLHRNHGQLQFLIPSNQIPEAPILNAIALALHIWEGIALIIVLAARIYMFMKDSAGHVGLTGIQLQASSSVQRP